MAPRSDMISAALEARERKNDNLPHDNYGPWFNGVVWMLTGVAAIFLALRLYCKHIRRKALWWDDYVLIAAFFALVAQTATLSVYVHYGFGKHTWDIHDFVNYLFVANLAGVLSITAAAWSKTSFAILLLHFTEGRMRQFVWFVIVTVNLFLGLSAIFTYAQCTPVRRLWDKRVPGQCWDSHVVIYYNTFSSVWSGVMDIVLAFLPWWIINRRSLNRKERLGVLLAMSMGAFAGATSIAKTAFLPAIANADTIYSVNLMILATAETAITIMAASIPVLRVLIKNTMKSYSIPRFYRSFRTEATYNTGDSKLMSSTAPSSSSPGSSQFSRKVISPPISPAHLNDEKSPISPAPAIGNKSPISPVHMSEKKPLPPLPERESVASWWPSSPQSGITRIEPAVHPLRSHNTDGRDF